MHKGEIDAPRRPERTEESRIALIDVKAKIHSLPFPAVHIAWSEGLTGDGSSTRNYHGLAAWLNVEGVKPPRGAMRWTEASVRWAEAENLAALKGGEMERQRPVLDPAWKEGPLISGREAAKLLGVSRRTIDNMREAGEFWV